MVDRVLAEYRQQGATPELLAKVAAQGPLGRILAAGLANVKAPRPVMKEAIEEVGRVVTHDLERFLTTLGTIARDVAAARPLRHRGRDDRDLRLAELRRRRTRSSSRRAFRSRSTTRRWASSSRFRRMIFYRHFRAKVDALVVEMEQQAIKLVDFAHGERK